VFVYRFLRAHQYMAPLYSCYSLLIVAHQSNQLLSLIDNIYQ
jgi:hypothetical protein